MYKKSTKKKPWSLLKTVLIIIFILIVSFIYFELMIKPVVWGIAETVALEMANIAISEATSDENLAPLIPENLVIIKKDKAGNITFVQTNLAVTQPFAIDVSLRIQDRMNSFDINTTEIPLGSLLDSPLLAGKGPKIKLSIKPIGGVTTNIKSEFLETGINQTTLKIYLTVKADIRIILPFIPTKTAVSSQIIISETVIQGKVPQQFLSTPIKLP